jgi:translation initiation factor IF-3
LTKQDVSTFQFHANISEHDVSYRLRQMNTILDKGNKIRVEVRLRGREKDHANLGVNLLNNIINHFGDTINVEHKSDDPEKGIAAVFSRRKK